jgi:hypothetical protein
MAPTDTSTISSNDFFSPVDAGGSFTDLDFGGYADVSSLNPAPVGTNWFVDSMGGSPAPSAPINDDWLMDTMRGSPVAATPKYPSFGGALDFGADSTYDPYGLGNLFDLKTNTDLAMTTDKQWMDRELHQRRLAVMDANVANMNAATAAQKAQTAAYDAEKNKKLYEKEWFWQATISAAAILFQMSESRADRKQQRELLQMQIDQKDRAQEAEFAYATAVNSTGSAVDSARGATRSGFENHS